MKKLILITFLTLSTYYIYQSIDIESFFSRDRTKSFKDAKVSVTYILKKDNWLIFNIPRDDTLFKILSTANIKSKKIDYDKELNYAINYQIIDSNNKILLNKIYHFNTKVLNFIKDTKNIRPSYYLNNSITPALSKKKFINISNFPNAFKIKFKIHSMDEEMKDIAIRTYKQEKNREDKLSYLWERLKRSTKESLSTSNVYSYELMNENEKRNVLREVFRPFGPLGVSEKDYFIRKLYVLKDEEIESVDERLQEFIQNRDFNKSMLIKKSYLLENNLTFKINHFRDLTTSIRLDVNLVDKNISTLNYSLFDNNLNILKEENLKIETNSTKYFFRFNKNISKIKFTSNDKLFISLYNRLYNFPRVEVLKNSERNVSAMWFNLKPIDEAKEMFLKLNLNNKNIEDNLSFYSIYPLNLNSDYLFIDYNLSENYSQKSLNSIYSKIPLNKKNNINFDYILNNITPKLIFKKQNFRPQKIEIYLNNKLYFKDELIGTKGSIKLPIIKRGKYKLLIKTKNIKIYMSNIINNNLKKKKKRLVNRFKKNSFYFNKTKDSELISLKIFQPFNSKNIKIKLKINSNSFVNNHYKNFTFLNREYIIYPNKEYKTYILNRDLIFDNGNLIFINLNEDLPNIEYKIDIESNKEVYFNIYSKMDKVNSFDTISE